MQLSSQKLPQVKSHFEDEIVHVDFELASLPRQNKNFFSGTQEIAETISSTKPPSTTSYDFKSVFFKTIEEIPKILGCEKPVNGPRVFQVNDCVVNRDRFCSNYVKTTRYTKWNFLPLCLFVQYTKVSNLYFLLSAIIQAIPIISPLQPYTGFTPLIVVVAFSMCREAYEDYLRQKCDELTNK